MRAFLVLICLLLSHQSAMAEEPDLRIAYVNMGRALNEVHDGKVAKAKLKSDFEKKQKKLDEMQQGLKQKKEDFEKKQSYMKPEVRQQEAAALQQAFVEMQQTYVGLQRELMNKEGKVTQQIAEKLRRIISKIGDGKKYHLILDIGDTVLYHKRHLDITEEIVQEYNTTYAKN